MYTRAISWPEACAQTGVAGKDRREPMAKTTFFVDLREANEKEKLRIASRLQQLVAIETGGYRPLTKEESAELALLQILNEDRIPTVDPLFIATKFLFDQTFRTDIPFEDN